MPADPTPEPPRWQRLAWMAGGWASLLAGLVGLFLPLLPTAPLVILAAFCFARGSPRWEQWLLEQPRFGPLVRDWRERRAVPLRAKQLATLMMAVSAGAAWWVLAPSLWRWVPALCCTLVALWLWRLPTAEARG